METGMRPASAQAEPEFDMVICDRVLKPGPDCTGMKCIRFVPGYALLFIGEL